MMPKMSSSGCMAKAKSRRSLSRAMMTCPSVICVALKSLPQGCAQGVPNTKTMKTNQNKESKMQTKTKSKFKMPEVKNKPVEKPKVETRASLMIKAKDQKVKYFRIMNALELSAMLDPNVSDAKKGEITNGAIKRWKQGWSDKPKATTPAKPETKPATATKSALKKPLEGKEALKFLKATK
jgi:hypothetical protein